MVPREGANPMAAFLVQVILIIGIFYFLLIRPQSKQRRLHQEMLKKLARGDRVMTNGGIIGEVLHAGKTELLIRTAENTRIVVDRGHVARKIEEDANQAKK